MGKGIYRKFDFYFIFWELYGRKRELCYENFLFLYVYSGKFMFCFIWFFFDIYKISKYNFKKGRYYVYK